MDLRIRFNQQLVTSIVVGEVITLMWFYEPLRQRRLFTVTWVLTSVVATVVVAVLLQLITGQVRVLSSWKQAASTAMWIGMLFALLEASQIPGLFTTRAVLRAFVHGMHKFTIVFAMLIINVTIGGGEDESDDESDESEGSSEEESEGGTVTTVSK